MASASSMQYLETAGNGNYRISLEPKKNHVNRKHAVK